MLRFLFPSRCFACSEPLGKFQRYGACLECWGAFSKLMAPCCTGCGLPRPPGTDLLGPARGRCAACVLHPPSADFVRAAVAYDSHARLFLLRAKLGRRRELFRPLATQLAVDLELCGGHRGCTMIVPVPSHPWSKLRRGFDPALEIGRPLAGHLGLPLRPRELLRRVPGWVQFKRMSAMRRRAAARGAFRARRADSLAGQRVLLVDDVMTTGATVEACTRALKTAGVIEVRVAVWARTLLDPSAR